MTNIENIKGNTAKRVNAPTITSTEHPTSAQIISINDKVLPSPIGFGKVEANSEKEVNLAIPWVNIATPTNTRIKNNPKLKNL